MLLTKYLAVILITLLLISYFKTWYIKLKLEYELYLSYDNQILKFIIIRSVYKQVQTFIHSIHMFNTMIMKKEKECLCFYRALLLNFVSSMYISAWLGNIFKFVGLKLLENVFSECQKTEKRHFTHVSPGKTLPRLLSPPKQREITHSPSQCSGFFLKICFLSQHKVGG